MIAWASRPSLSLCPSLLLPSLSPLLSPRLAAPLPSLQHARRPYVVFHIEDHALVRGIIAAARKKLLVAKLGGPHSSKNTTKDSGMQD
ncbi:hypothetical protein B0H10DRAFT_1994029 [Mycena sp. CBHHK59/15]|nr:hypothetical protein B0H10DRAFT_1994029 [Mycena sp. CBHHK59/15]